MHKSFLLCCLFFLSTVSIYSQVESENNIRELIKVPIPPSPNAASLGKYGDIPVGLSTGIPSIGIPIFSWEDQLKELKIDVGLSYHAGGHKVEDMASNCGLGWSLQAGGLISRTIRGVPDDGPGGYLNTQALRYVYTISNEHLDNPPYSATLGIHHAHSEIYDTVRGIAERMVDGEFDIFNLNVGNISAKFFIDKIGSIVFFTQNNLSLSYERYPTGSQWITKFIMIDERAIKYIFDVQEISEGANLEAMPGSQPMSNISSFYLSKIISADKKDSILFSYSSGSNLLYEGGFSETWRVGLRQGITLLSPTSTYSYNVISTTSPKRISLIKLPDSTQITFTYSFARDDYYGDYALTSVGISDGFAQRKYDLTYDYFSSASDPSASYIYSDNDYGKRLKLTKVQQISGSDSLPPHLFQYNSQNLPPRNSKAQDHWGYYNGLPNAVLITRYPKQPNDNLPELDGANRAPNETYAKAAILEKITYPTGGFTKFEYHINNSYSLLYNIASVKDSLSLDESSVGNFSSLSLPNRNKDTVQFTVRLFNNLPPPENEPWSDDCPVTITIKSTDNTVTRTINSHYSLVPIELVVLPQGKTYQIKYETECSWLEDFSVSVQYLYSITPTNKNVGGLRVEKVEDNDSSGNKIVTEYQYLKTDSTSSGEIQNIPNYGFYKSSIFLPIDLGGPIMDYFWNMVATPTQTLTYFSGSPIIYTRVKVKKSSPNIGMGYSVHEFSGVASAGLVEDYYPHIQKQPMNWLVGLELRDSIFSESGQLVKSNTKEWESFYFYTDSSKARNVVTGLIYHDYMGTPTQYVYAARAYNMIYGRSQLKKSIECLYENGDSLKKTTWYTYDLNNYLTKTVRTQTSIGDTIEERFYYPSSYLFPTAEGLNTLIASEYWKKKDTTWYLTGATINQFDEFDSLFTKQKKIYTAEIQAPISLSQVGIFDSTQLTRHSIFKKQAEFLKYDTLGRYVEIQDIAQPITSFIWSNYRNYPSAKIANASSIDVAYSSFESVTKGNWGYSGVSTVHATAPTGLKAYDLSGGSIVKSGMSSSQSYSITYWKRDSANTVSVNGGSGTVLMAKNGWSLMNHTLTGVTTITVAGTGFIDELRLHPSNSQMTSFTYSPLLGITSKTDHQNRINYFEYDNFGRLKIIRDIDKNIINVFEYKYNQALNQ